MLAKDKPLIVAGIVAVALFFVTAVLSTGGYSRGVDGAVIGWFNGLESGGLTATFKAITYSGEFYTYLGLCAVLLIIPRTRVDFGAPVTAVVLITGAMNASLKQVFREPRPDTHRLIAESGYSFPSGHAMFAAAAVSVVIVLLARHCGSRAVTVVLSVVLVVFALGVGSSRVYLGVHWPVDILGGYLAGFATCVVVVVAWDLWWARIVAAVGRQRAKEVKAA